MATTIREDMHIHSRFSDGKATIQENVEQALRRGLTRICCVDHVRRNTPWVPEFVAEVHQAQRNNPTIPLYCGLEAKILNQSGALDLPDSIAGADYIYAADHRFPLGDECYSPEEIRERLKNKSLTEAGAIASLVEATRNAMLRRPALVLAHLFSILPKVHLDESAVSDAQLQELARTARLTGATIEVDERWRCPSLRTTAAFHKLGVPVICSTDSHSLETVGNYIYVQGVWENLHGYISN